jgi:hypothetical protein
VAERGKKFDNFAQTSVDKLAKIAKIAHTSPRLAFAEEICSSFVHRWCIVAPRLDWDSSAGE